MTNFLPYAIIAGIAIVFFVICYIMYSSGEKSESSPQPEKQNGKTKTRTRYDGEPQPRKVQHRRPATVKHARQLPNLAVEEDTELAQSSENEPWGTAGTSGRNGFRYDERRSRPPQWANRLSRSLCARPQRS